MAKKAICKIAAGILMAVILCVSLLPQASSAAYTYKYLDEFIGISKDQFVKQLEKHEHDSYYNGTPYIGGDNRNSKGDPYHKWGMDDKYGKPGFNCTGFVWRALVDAGASYKNIPLMTECSRCWQNPKWPGYNSWWSYIKGGAGFYPYYYKYSTVRELLESGRAEKGDIIFMLYTGTPSPYSGIVDCHVGIFWGDTPFDNKMWHSGPTTVYGKKYATGITTINACSPSKYYLLKWKPTKKTGWSQKSSGWYYYISDEKLVNQWRKVQGVWYYFGKDGVMQTGLLTVKGKTYFLGSDGAMFTGWKKIKGTWRLFGEDGAMLTGWHKESGKWYYLEKDGSMAVGWEKLGKKYYLFDKNGEMLTGWQKKGGHWFFLEDNGIMQTGWKKISGKWYYFEKNGAMVTGKKKISGKWYRFNRNGALQ